MTTCNNPNGICLVRLWVARRWPKSLVNIYRNCGIIGPNTSSSSSVNLGNSAKGPIMGISLTITSCSVSFRFIRIGPEQNSPQAPE